METPSKQQVARGVAWASFAQWGVQLLSFGTYAGLARLLSPQIFGLVAIAGIYIAFMQIFVQQGFSTAIVQRHELEREHADSAFWIATAAGSLLCLLSILLAGGIARLFHEPKVSPVIGWLSISFLFFALGATPEALLTRNMEFRALAVRSLAANAAGGVVGLTMAFLGFGVWSLVGQQLAKSVLSCVCLWRAVPWRPSFRVSRRHLRDLYGFSLSITGNDILWFFCQNSDQTLVGYGFGSQGLGPYSLASKVVTLLHNGLIGPVQSVALPTFSALQLEPSRLQRAVLRLCEMSAFLALPLFAGIIVLAHDLVPLLFGAGWSPAVPVLRVLAVYGALRAVFSFLHPLMIAKGRPGLYFMMFAFLSCLTFFGCLIAVRWNPVAIALSTVVTMVIFGAFTFLVPLKILEINVLAVLRAFAFPGLSSLFMLTVVALTRGYIGGAFGPTTTVAICVVTGGVTYVLVALLIRPDLVSAVWEMISHSLLAAKFRNRLVPPGESCIANGTTTAVPSNAAHNVETSET